MLFKFTDQSLSKVYYVRSFGWILRLQQVVVDEVGLVQILLKLIKLRPCCLNPIIGILKQALRYTLHLSDLILDERQVLLQDHLSLLLLYLQYCLQLIKLFFKGAAQFIGLVTEFAGHLPDLHLIDTILGNILNDLIHLY